MSFLSSLGQRVLNFLTAWGEVTILTGTVLKRCVTRRGYFNRTITQMISLGIKSLPITLLTSTFVGMSFSVQIVKEFLRFGAGEMIGGIVGLAMWRELAPMMTAVVVAGRVGAAISAEIGTMKVTEQIEALEAMSQDPIDFLVIPRVLACTLMMPLLVGMADIVGFLGGFIVAISSNRVNPYAYFDAAQKMLYPLDIYGGLFKAVLFGLAISLISCYVGLNAKAGAKGVGEVTTKAVVFSLIAIFILNYFLSVAIY